MIWLRTVYIAKFLFLIVIMGINVIFGLHVDLATCSVWNCLYINVSNYAKNFSISAFASPLVRLKLNVSCKKL